MKLVNDNSVTSMMIMKHHDSSKKPMINFFISCTATIRREFSQ